MNSTQLDHVSVASTATKRWEIEPLTARDEATNDLSVCIDPNYVDEPQPPASLPKMLLKRTQVFVPGAHYPGQEELFALADAGRVPAHQDRRAQAEETMAMILAWGERLGTLTLVD